ncbi:5'-methylthioadenosine/adenosylhomocysteine nucleosidase [Thermovenabulum sp.]|uniref:5'-methylthioadenosine/adenosylhomocysteine nucleosidase n=1 Tax=Thermovenabulum sp. TaxID=3100335 RepID=UPI003C7D31C9
MLIIGIIGAMDREIKLLRDRMSDVKELRHLHLDFYFGEIRQKEVVIVKSGVGKVNAALCTQFLIDKFSPERIICTGVAGGLLDFLKTGDVVVSKDLIQYDVDASVFGHEVGEIPNMGVKVFNADEELVEKTLYTGKKILKDNKIIKGRILTGDKFVNSRELVEYLVNNFDGFCVEMEGAAIAHVCFLNQIPFVVIRSISDKADGSALLDYKNFVEFASKTSAEIVEGLIEII